MDIFGLNDDCMREIFKYCSPADLYQLCIVSNKMKAAVLELGVPGKLIDFDELVAIPTSDIFTTFGKAMTKVRIAERHVKSEPRNVSNFDEILRLISTYCAIDNQLKYLSLECDRGPSDDKRYLLAVLPFLRGIESFTILRNFRSFRRSTPIPVRFRPPVTDFIDLIAANAINLQSIHIEGFAISGTFFYLQHIRNLRELILSRCEIGDSDAFISFMEHRPKLKTLKWYCSNVPELTRQVYDVVQNNVSNLEVFHYIPDSRATFDIADYGILVTKLKNLKTLMAYEATDQIMNTLAQKNSVRELIICGTRRYDEVLNLRNYTKLNYIVVFIHDQVDKDAYIEWLPELPCLTELQVSFVETFDYSFLVVLYMRLLERSEYHSSLKPLTLYIRNESVGMLLNELGTNYRKESIVIRAGEFPFDSALLT